MTVYAPQQANQLNAQSTYLNLLNQSMGIKQDIGQAQIQQEIARESGAAYESFLGIPGIDPPDMCEPFTPAELEKIGQKVEAIDRTGQESEFSVVRTAAQRAKIPGQGAIGARARRPVADGSQQFSPQAAEAARLAMTPPEGGEAARTSAGGGSDE